jgi:hypothetical protein
MLRDYIKLYFTVGNSSIRNLSISIFYGDASVSEKD